MAIVVMGEWLIDELTPLGRRAMEAILSLTCGLVTDVLKDVSINIHIRHDIPEESVEVDEGGGESRRRSWGEH